MRPMSHKELRRIGIIQTTEMACFREIIRGVHSYAAAQGTWHLELFSPFEEFVTLTALGGQRELRYRVHIADDA